jgi:hypothetical protein
MEAIHDLDLLLRQGFGFDRIEAEPSSDGFSHRVVITMNIIQ